MRYHVISYSKSGGYEKRENYDNPQSAQKKIDKSYKRYTCKIIAIPEDINIGFQFNTPNGYYGEIVNETDNFWIIKRANGRESEFLKSEIEDKFIRGVFMV